MNIHPEILKLKTKDDEIKDFIYTKEKTDRQNVL